MFGVTLTSFDYVSTMYLGENKVGYAQNKVVENFLWLIGSFLFIRNTFIRNPVFIYKKHL